MCMPKAPKLPPTPKMPSVYQSSNTEVVDQASLDANNRARRQQMAKYGRASTILAGAAAMAPGQSGMPPTTGAKSLLGN